MEELLKKYNGREDIMFEKLAVKYKVKLGPLTNHTPIDAQQSAAARSREQCSWRCPLLVLPRRFSPRHLVSNGYFWHRHRTGGHVRDMDWMGETHTIDLFLGAPIQCNTG